MHKEINSLIISAEEHPEITIIADVYANLHALNAVMEDAKSRGTEIFLNAGDFLGYGAFPDDGDRRGNYAILNIRSHSVNLIKVDYNIEKVQRIRYEIWDFRRTSHRCFFVVFRWMP